MTAEAASGAAMAARDALITQLSDAGFEFVEPAILQPSSLFLDLAGEDLRRRLFLTSGRDGHEMCLRPDYTIPVCRYHVSRSPDGTVQGAYAYFGPVFRQREKGPQEFLQAGIEWLGDQDKVSADADTLALAAQSARTLGVDDFAIKIGDTALFTALMEALELPAVWRRRLRAMFGDRARLDGVIDRLSGRTADDDAAPTQFVSALKGTGPDAAKNMVEEMLAIAGISAEGGRSAAEIAERFLEQAELAAEAGTHGREATVLRGYLDVAGRPDAAVEEIEGLTRAAGIDISPALENFSRRNELLGERGLALETLRFGADFGRRLDYYTGYTFELHHARKPDVGQIVGGGRYDALLSLMGAENECPAVGFSIWLERAGEV